MPPFGRRRGFGRGIPDFRRLVRRTINPPATPGQPFSVSPLSGATIVVEFAWGANPGIDSQTWQWSDETAHVMLSNEVQISVGRADELSTASTATCTFTVDNSSGRFMPYLQTGPNFPNVTRNVPVRVSVDAGNGAGRVVRFWGYATSFTPAWDTTGQAQALVTVQASGALRRLEQGRKPLRSPLSRAILASPNLQGYWPCEDGTGALSVSDVSGRNAAIPAGYNVDFGQGTPPAGSSTLVKLGQDGVLSSAVASAKAPDAWSFNVLVNIPTYAGTTTTTIATLTLTGATYPTVVILLIPNYSGGGTSPSIVLRWLDASGAIKAEDSAAWDYYSTSAFGKWVWVNAQLGRAYDMSAGQSVLQIRALVLEDGITLYNPSTAFLTGTPVPGAISNLTMTGNTAMVGALVGHISVWNIPINNGNLLLDPASDSAFASAVLAYLPQTQNFPPATNIEFPYESATDRFARLCLEQNIPYTLTGSSNVNMGAQTIDTLTNLLRECESSDGGTLYDGFGQGLTYLARSAKYGQAPGLSLDMAQGQVSEPFAPVDDDQKNRNDWQVSRVNGSSAEYIDEASPLGTGAIGVYDSSVTLNLATDDVLPSHASWRVHLGTVQGLRYPTLTFDLVAVPSAVSAWLAADLGSRIDVLNVSSAALQHPTGTVSLILEGYTETLSPFTWTIQANCSPADPWRTATIEPGDTSLAWRIDSAVSSIPQEYTPGVTSIAVTVTDGYLWSTAAGDYPQDINVGGVRVTVTAVSGASSPQTFTITPVTVTLHSGASVTLWDPPAIAL